MAYSAVPGRSLLSGGQIDTGTHRHKGQGDPDVQGVVGEGVEVL